jgi:hypothetical protein
LGWRWCPEFAALHGDAAARVLDEVLGLLREGGEETRSPRHDLGSGGRGIRERVGMLPGELNVGVWRLHAPLPLAPWRP